MLEVNASVVLRYEGDGTATIVGRHNRDSIDVFRVGERLPADERLGLRRACCATGAPARIDDWGGLTGEVAEAIFRTGYRSTAAAPIVVAGTLWGAVAIASEDPLPPDTENRLGAFCELASLAVASAQARADLIASRARLVKAGDEQRRRLERNLHDGAQQRLVSVALKLRLARARAGLAPEAAADAARGRLARARHRPRRSCASSRAGCTRRSSATSGCARALEALAERLAGPGRDRRGRRAAARARRGDGVLHRLRGADQRRQARGGDPRARVGPPRRRRPALRGRRRRPRRRRHVERDRHPRPARPRRGGGRHASLVSPPGPRDGRRRRCCR